MIMKYNYLDKDSQRELIAGELGADFAEVLLDPLPVLHESLDAGVYQVSSLDQNSLYKVNELPPGNWHIISLGIVNLEGDSDGKQFIVGNLSIPSDKDWGKYEFIGLELNTESDLLVSEVHWKGEDSDLPCYFNDMLIAWKQDESKVLGPSVRSNVSNHIMYEAIIELAKKCSVANRFNWMYGINHVFN